MLPILLFPQEQDRKGIHQIEYYEHLGKPKDHHTKAIKPKEKTYTGEKPAVQVFGWHPYWAANDEYKFYDYNALHTIGFFSYAVDPGTGSYTTIHGWDKTPIIEYAHQRDVKVVLVITNFGYDNNDILLSDPQKRATLISESVSLVKEHDGDGINIDFENIRSSQRENLSLFMTALSYELKSEIPEAELSICLPAVYWTEAFDLDVLSDVCDYLIIMGYNYFWSGSNIAGPVAPLENRYYCVKNSILDNLEKDVPKHKLYLGVPWYGIDWPVESSDRMSATTGTGTARIFPAMEDLAKTHDKTFDVDFKTPWIAYHDEQWRQAWYDDSLSLSHKYKMVESFGLGGIGIWAISYHDNEGIVWEGIRNYFKATDVSENISNKLSLYPNPCKDYIRLEISEYHNPEMNIKIRDLTGVEIFNTNLFYKNTLLIDFNAVDISPGLYILELNTGIMTYSELFIKI